jgi:HEAT repeats
MAIVFTCSGCGNRFSVDEMLAGKKIKCNDCAQVTAVPAAQVQRHSAPKHNPPRYDDFVDEPAAPLKRAVQARSAESEADPPPPRRVGYRPASALRKSKNASASSLSVVIKIGLMLIGGLLAIGASGLLFVGITSGHAELIWFAIALLSTCVFGGIAAVCNLKLMFMGAASEYGGLPWYTPFRSLIWVLSNLSDTGPLLLGNLAGIAGLVIVWALTIPYVKTMKDPKHVAAAPAKSGQAGAFQMTIDGPDGRQIFVTATPATAAEIAEFNARNGPGPENPSQKTSDNAPEGDSASKVVSASKPDALRNALADLKSSVSAKPREAVAKLRRIRTVEDQCDAVRQALKPLLDDEDGFFVIDVARVMAKWLTPETVPTLIPKLSDSRNGVRWEVIKILGELGDARAARAIAERLKEDGIAADSALRRLGSAAEPALIELLKNPDPDFRRKACQILRLVGGKDTLAFMKSAKADPDAGVRMEAQITMKMIHDRLSLPAKGANSPPRTNR